MQLWVQAARAGFRIKEVGIPRLYLDPNRAFGGVLDDPTSAWRITIGSSPPPKRKPIFTPPRRSPRRPVPSACGPRGIVGEYSAVPRAPTDDGAVTAEPPLPEVDRLLTVNRQRLRGDERRQWREAARRAAIDAARQFMPSAENLSRTLAASVSSWRAISRSYSIRASGSKTSPSTAWHAVTA